MAPLELASPAYSGRMIPMGMRRFGTPAAPPDERDGSLLVKTGVQFIAL